METFVENGRFDRRVAVRVSAAGTDTLARISWLRCWHVNVLYWHDNECTSRHLKMVVVAARVNCES